MIEHWPIFNLLVANLPKVFAGAGWTHTIHRLGAFAVVLCHIRPISDWMRRNSDNPLLLRELRHSGPVYHAIFRPYVNRHWTLAQRLNALEQHYRTLQDRGQVLDIGDDQYFDLLQLGPEYLNLRVAIDRPSWMRREGELAVSLFWETHRIYTAQFLIVGASDHRSLVVGALQGWSKPEAKNTYVQLTRALHGLRPRDFLINVLKCVAVSLDCTEILGISDSAHRSSNLLTSAYKHAMYDEIWIEHDGKRNAEGFFAISPEIRQREPVEVPSRKRAQYRRRYEFLRDVQQRIRNVFATRERRLMTHGVDELGQAPMTAPDESKKVLD